MQPREEHKKALKHRERPTPNIEQFVRDRRYLIKGIQAVRAPREPLRDLAG